MRILAKFATAFGSGDHLSEGSTVYYLNRDHVIIASVGKAKLVLTTTLGEEITITGSRAELAGLVEELVRSIQSNFVPIGLSREKQI